MGLLSKYRSRSINTHFWHDNGKGLRVLIEDSDYARASAISRILSEQGMESVICHGPEKILRTKCPLVQDDYCPLVTNSDLIIFGFDLGDPEYLQILASIVPYSRKVPVVVLLGDDPSPIEEFLPATIFGVSPPITSRKMARAVEIAMKEFAEQSH